MTLIEFEKLLDKMFMMDEIRKKQKHSSHNPDTLSFISLNDFKSFANDLNDDKGSDFFSTINRILGPNRSWASVFKKIDVDYNNYMSKIKKDSIPTRDTIIKIIFGLECNIHEAIEILKSAKYTFSDNTRDKILKKAIEEQFLDFEGLDRVLIGRGCDTLFYDKQQYL